MKTKWKLYIGLLLTVIIAGCTADDGIDSEIVQTEAIEMTGFKAVIEGDAAAGTRDPAALAIELGRANFVANDQVVFTQIKRTTDPIETYTYSNKEFSFNGSTWSKITDGNLYWSDATNPHTFIAYSNPQGTFDWTESEGVYSGTIGDGGTGEQVSFSSLEDLKNEDLLIAYSTTMTANSGSVPLVEFHHALSSVRVEVHLENFPSGSGATVTDMMLLHQPTKYVWDQTSWGVSPVTTDQIRKNLKLYIPTPAGVSNEFTFYGITTPQNSTYIAEQEGDNQKAELTFKVNYTESETAKTQNYSISQSNVYFEAGYNTTITIRASKN